MDPQARRRMWQTIEELSQRRSLILVSHSMEEVEALCTKIGAVIVVESKVFICRFFLYTVDSHCIALQSRHYDIRENELSR
jgi:energy-coupling factor transporter ATP-binding protein EcfA2